MKKLELIFIAVLVPLDYLALLLAGTLAYFLRFESFVTEIRPVIFAMSYEAFFKVLAMAALAWLAVFVLNGLYSLKRQNLLHYLARIFISCSAATLIIVVAFFFNFQLFSSRLIVLTGWLLSIVIVGLERLAIYYIKKIFYKKGIGVRQVAIIGSGKSAQDLFNEFQGKPSYGFRVAARFPTFDNAVLSQLKELVAKNQLDEIVLAQPQLPAESKNQLVDFCLEHHLIYKYVASLLETQVSNFSLSTVAGLPLMEVKQTRLDGWGRILKRLFDLIIALLLLIILAPLLLALGLLVKITSAGEMIVKLARVGAEGQIFQLYKFRSMIKDAHQLKKSLLNRNERDDGPLFKMQNDPRITACGRFIRRWSLDEWPQLVNVLLGQMSLVGPRPHEPEEVASYETKQKKLLAIKPGITGLAQVAGRSDLAWDEEVSLDTYYVENWSLGLDIQILLKTPKAVFGRKGAV